MIMGKKKAILQFIPLEILHFKSTILVFLLSCIGLIHAQDITAIQNMTTEEREQAFKQLTLGQQEAVREVMKAQRGSQVDTSASNEMETVQFKGFHLPPEEGVEGDLKRLKDSKPEVIGTSYFRTARERILIMEDAIKKGNVPPVNTKDALAGYVGPLESISSYVQTGTPERYYLSPGDEILITYWGTNLAFTSRILKVNSYGEVQDPGIGKMVVRGMTLQQFESAAREQYIRNNNPVDFKFFTTLGRLKSIQVFITGEAFRPGSYSVSSVTTLFNALYACGGPTDDGSLREIRLIRGKTSYHVDLYDFLLKASTKGDYALQGGDIIYIARTGKRILVEGEVYTPGIYEVKPGENLDDLLNLTGGIKSSGLKNNVFIETTLPNQSRITRDVNMTDRQSVASYTLMDDDRVFVRPIFSRIKNYITVLGNVENPGSFELKPGLHLLEVVRSALPLEDTYMDRAVITRFHFDTEEYVRIPINLQKLLSGDVTQNIALAAWDTLRVFSRAEIDFTPGKMVAIRGAVQRPGNYVRSKNMRISDLVFSAGGLLPDVWLDKALLKRWDFEKNNWILITVDLNLAIKGDPEEDRILEDKDVLDIFNMYKATFVPVHEVTISGNVQRPGKYARVDSMRVKDLIFEAGGLLPGYNTRASLARAYSENETEVVQIDLGKLMNGELSDNFLLQDQDILNIKKRSNFFEHPQYVSITGEVNSPGPFALRNKKVRLSEAIQQADGFTERAYPKGLILRRRRKHLVQDDQIHSLEKSNQAVTRESKIQYYQEGIKNRLALANVLNGEEDRTGSGLPQLPTVSGSVISGDDVEKAMAAGLVSGIADESGKMIQSTMENFSTNPHVGAVYRQISNQELGFSDMVRISVNIDDILNDKKHDIILKDGDEIFIPEKPDVVHIRGAVNNVMTLNYVENKKIEYYIERAGGLDQDADEDRIRILRMDGAVWVTNNIKFVEQGDIIYVPTKVMSTEIRTNMDKILDVIRYTLSAAASITVFLVLIEKIGQ